MTLFACSCEKKQSDCESFDEGFVSAVDAPATGKVNEPIPVEVSFAVLNGCGQFERFEEVVTGKTTTITVIARYKGCPCTDDIPTRRATYTFLRPSPGTYYLEFETQIDQGVIRDTIQINQ